MKFYKSLKLNRLNSKGQSAVEFAFIIPIIFIFFYAVLEFSFLFVRQQRISSISRETANAAFRDCASLSESAIGPCLDKTLAGVHQNVQSILPDFDNKGTVIVSVYGLDTTNNSNPPPLKSLGVKKIGSGSNASHYSLQSIDATVVRNQGVVVVGEAFYAYTPLTPIEGLLNLLSLPKVIYENSIF